jgi:hypothetical protein
MKPSVLTFSSTGVNGVEAPFYDILLHGKIRMSVTVRNMKGREV